MSALTPDLTALLLTRQERSVIAACITVAMSAPTTTVNEGRSLMELWMRVHPDPEDVT
jgi:hypothetical protein